MHPDPIRLGFIGLRPDNQWAATAHLPALASLGSRFTIVGAANTRLESSRRTAAALGLPRVFEDAAALVGDPDIDLVVVTVKVPHHLELVSAALNAGKHVFCEWPLGNGLDEARQLAQLADAKGVVAVAGTQLRVSIEMEFVRDLVASGYVGRVLSSTLIGSGGQWSNESTGDYLYLSDKHNGATLLSIPLAHTLAGLRDVLGEVETLSARFVTLYDTVRLTDTGEVHPKTSPDQVMLHGVMASGAALSVHYRGGTTQGTGLLWEINGTEGVIQITGSLGHAQLIPLEILGARSGSTTLESLAPDASAYEGWPEDAAARNVARLYARIADDIQKGTRTAPSFGEAVALHALVDSIERSAATI